MFSEVRSSRAYSFRQRSTHRLYQGFKIVQYVREYMLGNAYIIVYVTITYIQQLGLRQDAIN